MQNRMPLVVFLALLVLFSAAMDALVIASGFTMLVVVGLMWSVALAAFVTMRLYGLPFSELGWSFGPTRYHLIAVALPLGYGLVGYGLAGALGLASFPAAGRIEMIAHSQHLDFLGAPLGFAVTLALSLTVGLIQSMARSLGEEIGWRGFFTPRLAALIGFTGTSLVVGAIWAVWHMPLIVFSAYNGGGDTGFELLSFFVMVVSMTSAMTWLRLKSASLWPCVTFHAAHNLLIQSIFDNLTQRGPGHITMVGEFGVVLAATVFAFSLPFWIMGRRDSAFR